MPEAGTLFDEIDHASSKPTAPATKRVLVTVKAAPNPSDTHGETVCVAGVELNSYLGAERWIRLYPINFRYLQDGNKFKKGDVIEVPCKPAVADIRFESWKPDMDRMVKVLTLEVKKRRIIVDPMATDTMCRLYRDAQKDNRSRSLGLARPSEVLDFIVRPHPGWTDAEQRKIDKYTSQPTLYGPATPTPLRAPAYQGWYRWRCEEPGCSTHRSMLLDWEFVALQQNLLNAGKSATGVIDGLREKFLLHMCGPGRDTAFYLGNQAKRAHTFSILGVHWPAK